MTQKMLVISAHPGDFVWRSAGTVAKYVNDGWQVRIICLTYGARGESAAFYKNTGGDYEACCETRRAEAENAAEKLGAEICFCGYEDFCLEMDPERIRKLAEDMKAFEPDIILTHDTGKDRVNPDHTAAGKAVLTAYELAVGSGMKQVPVFGFEPLNPELCGYKADVYIDVTDAWEQKIQAMECLATQKKSRPAYEEKAVYRASYASGRGGNKSCRYAETFSRFFPIVELNDFPV